MTEYIITEEQLVILCNSTSSDKNARIANKVIEHPYNPQAERERVLDEMLAALQNEGTMENGL